MGELDLITQAIEQYDPSHVFALFSGGDDSLTATSIAAEHPNFTAAVHIDTGIGVWDDPDDRRSVARKFVEQTCKERGWPLLVYEAAKHTKGDGTPDPQVYEQLVLEQGFPGCNEFGHRKMYNRLKERQLKQLLREHGNTRRKIMFISGCRSGESERRMGNTRPVDPQGRSVWVNPIHDWSKDDCFSRIKSCSLGRNPCSINICKSGECMCVDGDTLILTEDGWSPIRDISIGDPIWNYTDGLLGVARVAVVHRNDPQPMLSLKPAHLRPLLVTDNHPIFARTYRYGNSTRGKPPCIGEPMWLNAAEIAKQWRDNRNTSTLKRTMHLVGVPYRTHEIPLNLTSEKLRLLGHFAAEGAYNWRTDKYRNGPGGIVFTLSAEAVDHISDITHCIKSGLGLPVHRRDWIDKRTGRAFVTVRNCSKESSDFVSQFFKGRYCAEKQFSDSVVTASLSEQDAILSAAWQGDGSEFTRPANGNVSTYTTGSLALALQVHEMLLRQGRIYGIHSSQSRKYDSSDLSGGMAYQVRVEGGKRGRMSFLEAGVLWTPICHVSDVGNRETFNLTIAGSPNYRTGSGLVHNCGAFAKSGELNAELKACYPEFVAYIRDLEQRVWDAGFPWKWDESPPKWFIQQRRGQGMLFDMVPEYDGSMPMCQSCVLASRTTDG